MIRAVLKDGRIQPLEPLPIEWSEGTELVIEDAVPSETSIAAGPADLDAWAKEFEEAVAQIAPEDASRIRQALDEADALAKDQARRAMGHCP